MEFSTWDPNRVTRIRRALIKMGYRLRKDRRAIRPLYYVVDPDINAAVLTGDSYSVGVELDAVASWAGLKI